MNRSVIGATGGLLVAVLWSLSGLETPVRGEDKPELKTVTAGDLELRVPGRWKFSESQRQFRAGEFVIPPGEGDQEQAELVVYYFGKNGAGGVKANIDRWINQFEADGRTVKTLQGKGKYGEYVLVELSGTYKKPIGPPVQMKSTPKEGWKVLGAILTTDNGPYFLKFDGPAKTIGAEAAAFRSSFGGAADSEEEIKPAE